jgi:hypothetical protein
MFIFALNYINKMEEIHEEIKEAIKGLDSWKHRYPKMETQDVIDMLKRLNENVKLTLTDVGITLTERIVKPEKHILDNEGKRIRIEKPPFN